jgi:hypothetical protein
MSDEPYAAQRPGVELNNIGHATDAVSDQARENAPFALRPLTKVAVACRKEALGVSAPLAWGDRFAKHLDMLAGSHFQPSTAKNVFDLRWVHGCILATSGALASSRCAVTQSVSTPDTGPATTATSPANETKRASRAACARRAQPARRVVRCFRSPARMMRSTQRRQGLFAVARDVARPGMLVNSVAAKRAFRRSQDDIATLGTSILRRCPPFAPIIERPRGGC